ncbi:hypothetical protein C0J52_23681 [Blattella germanica]|nr:hypothetical protein C0J52_23681 [Blattella germanica]
MSHYSDISSDNEDFQLRRAPRVFQHRSNPMIELNDKQFKMRFRLPKNVVEELEGRLHAQLQTKTNRNHALNPIFMILLTLRFYASDDVPEIDAAIFRGRRLYQELPAPAINHINGRDNTALRTTLINNTFR